MKKKITILIALLLVFAGAFIFRGRPAAFSLISLKRFPELFSETGVVHWELETEGEELDGTEEMVYSRACRYELYNRDCQFRCQFLLYDSHVGTAGLIISFMPENIESITEQQYESFLKGGLPEIWTLASKLCSNPKAILDLQRQIEAAYPQVMEEEQYRDRISYFSEWGAQSAGIYATARVVKQDEKSMPMWSQIRMVSKAEYNDISMLETWELSQVLELEQKKTETFGSLQQKYFICGNLSEIVEAEEFQFRLTPSFPSLPANVSFYQKAVLTDESGSIPVYLSPTALKKQELEEKRLHTVCPIQNEVYEICYVITQSSILNEMTQ